MTFDQVIESGTVWYLYLCVIIAAVTICWYIYEDVTKKYDPKFGPNWKSGFSYFLLFLHAFPFINLAMLGAWAYLALRYPVRKRNDNPV